MSFQAFQKVSQITAVDEATHTTYGIMTEAKPDSAEEIVDYFGEVPYVKAWSQASYDATSAAGIGPSYGNMRLNHSLTIAGRVIEPPTFDDTNRQVWIRTQPTPDVWPLIRDGCVSGVSIGGTYQSRACDDCATPIERGNDCPTCRKHVLVRYTARLAECSYTDRPALPSATFQFVRSDGQAEMRKFRADPAASLAGTWQDDSVGFEDGGIPHYVFIPPPAESDATGFEGQGLPDDPTKPPDWSISSDDMSADATGFEQMRKQCLF